MKKILACMRDFNEVVQDHDPKIVCCTLVGYLKAYVKTQPNAQEVLEAIILSLRGDQEDHD